MISTYENFEKIIIRYMKCMYCNNEDIKTEIDHKISKSRSKKISKNRKTCKGCGKKLALEEYRYPDVYLEYRTFITIKHYKCISCGYMEISIKYDYIPSQAD
jgi:squalene cyclase